MSRPIFLLQALMLMSGLAAIPATASAAPHEVQQAVVTATGTVVDSKGEPVVGATVMEDGTSNGTITDIDGKFTIKASRGSQLRISYLGYQPQLVKAQADMRVQMSEDHKQLNEVVVVGYGMQKKVDITGAVANIDVDKAIASRPITDVAKAMQGISPGLTITNQTGGIGTQSKIRLRGSIGSLSATDGTQPLILVDNVEVPDINLVNPDDIESISVLKDAASASIYGTRAAWGVILITTKKGTDNNRVQVSYSNNFAWNTPTTQAELASTVDNAKFILAVANRLGTDHASSIGYYVDDYALGKMQDWLDNYGSMSESQLGEMQEGRDFEIKDGHTYFYRSFDPVKMFTRKWTPQQNHNMSIVGGNRNTTYNISGSYLTQKGVMKHNTDEYSRYTLTSNVTTKIRDWWSVHTNIMFSQEKNDQPYKFTSGQYDAWFYLLRWPRWYPYATYQGKKFRSAVTDTENGNRESMRTSYIRANAGTQLNPIKGLTINFDYTFGFVNYAQKRNGGTVTAYDMFTTSPFSNYKDIYGSSHNRVVQTSQYNLQNIFKGYATYDFNIAADHHFKLMAGMDAETRRRTSHYSERRTLISTTLPEIALATGDQYSYNSSYSYNKDFAAAGFFGRVNYDFKDRYLFEFNVRRDGSSRFPDGHKWATFPSFSAGWRASEETFFDWAKPSLSNLKVRGSWGTVGNQDVAENAFISTISNGNSGWVIGGQNQMGLSTPSVKSATLTWERVSTFDLGIEVGLFDNDLNFVFDWYRRVTSDMHTAGEQLPATFGASVPKINYGEMTGTGFELGVNYQHRFANGLGINLAATLSNVTEKITKYNKEDRNIYNYYEGKTLGEIWGYETDRLFQADDFNADGTLKEGIASQKLYESGNFKFGPGDVKYKDLDGDGEITYGQNTVEDHGDLKVIGNSLPKYEYSFTIGADWKGIDFSMYFQGVGKHDYWGYGSVVIPGGGSSYSDSFFAHQTDYWTESNTDAFYPRPSNNAWNSNGYNFLRQTRYLLNMAYLRCKNITVGYTLPDKWLKKIYMQKIRVYFSAENLFEFDHLGNMPVDPEATDYKTGYGSGSWSFGRSYPYSRTLSFGLQATF